MAQNEGEKELVLGNKQLISLFFVVVALCGVFFAMGYMMGRPSGKLTPVAETPPPAATVAPAPAASTQESEPPRETAAVPADTAPSATEPEGAEPVTHTRPARDVTPAAAAVEPSVQELGATYLQVTALRRADADNLVKTLREQNLPALVADSSKPDLFRVLVGPYRLTADVAEAKARLKALGFANAFVQK